jgi:hypothetical protein
MSDLASPPRVLTGRDWPLVERLFEHVFGHPLPRALTAWKYGPGRGLSIGVDAQADDTDSGQGEPPAAPRLLAHCGLMFRDVMAFGQPIQAAQLVDLMVAPHARGRLLRHGSPFAKVVGHALAQLGTAVNPHNPERVAFGFPSARAMKLAEHLQLVREVDRVHEVCWPPLQGPLPEPVLAADPLLHAMVDHMWSHMQRDLRDALVGVRRADYFFPRYLQHPTLQYQVHVVRSGSGTPLAVMALRPDGDRLELADWVAPLLFVPLVVRAAQAVAAAQSLSALTTWMTAGFAARLAPESAVLRETEFRIICRGDLPPALWDRHHHRWWLTPGDTDYR